jgi:hypothetical protein
MRRRNFIAGLSASNFAGAALMRIPFRAGLAKLGWTEGSNLPRAKTARLNRFPHRP